MTALFSTSECHQARILSGAIILSGALLASQDDLISQIAGRCLIRAGVNGGCYALYEVDYRKEDFFLKSFAGLSSGLLTGILGCMAYESKNEVATQIFFSVTDKISSLFLTKFLEVKHPVKRELPKGREVIGNLAELGVNEVFNRYGLPLLRNAIFPVGSVNMSAKTIFYNACIPSINAVIGKSIASGIEGNFKNQQLQRVFGISFCTHGLTSLFREGRFLVNQHEAQKHLHETIAKVKNASKKISDKLNQANELSQDAFEERQQADTTFFEAWKAYVTANQVYALLMIEAKNIQEEVSEISRKEQEANARIGRSQEMIRQEERNLDPILKRLQQVAGCRCVFEGKTYISTTFPLLKSAILAKFEAGESAMLEWEMIELGNTVKSVLSLDVSKYQQAKSSIEEGFQTIKEIQTSRSAVRTKAEKLEFNLRATQQKRQTAEYKVNLAREGISQAKNNGDAVRDKYEELIVGVKDLAKEAEEPFESEVLPIPRFSANLPKVSSHRIYESLPPSFDRLAIPEYVDHVILVHAINFDSLIGDIDLKDYNLRSRDDKADVVFQGLLKIITQEGTIVPYLKESEGTSSQMHNYRDRSRLHWSWNQLAQPSNRGDWEKAEVVIFEPLSTFIKDEQRRSSLDRFSPFDTITPNPHKLSANSRILVPYDAFERAKAYWSGCNVVMYWEEKPIRTAIAETLREHYRDFWPICDSPERETTSIAIPSTDGFFAETYLKKPDGESIHLISGSGFASNQQHEISPLIQIYGIGLHHDWSTDQLETKKYFKILKDVMTYNPCVRDKKVFAGNVENVMEFIRERGCSYAYNFYQEQKNTHQRRVANFVMGCALYADLASLFYHDHAPIRLESENSCLFSPFERQLMLAPEMENLVQKLSIIHGQDLAAAQAAFEEYCQKLRDCFERNIKAKNGSELFLRERNVNSLIPANYEKYLYFATKWEWCVLSDEWQTTSCNFQSFLPTEVSILIYKLCDLLPKNAILLKNIYANFFKIDSNRAKVLCAAVQWLIHQKLYLDADVLTHTEVPTETAILMDLYGLKEIEELDHILSQIDGQSVPEQQLDLVFSRVASSLNFPLVLLGEGRVFNAYSDHEPVFAYQDNDRWVFYRTTFENPRLVYQAMMSMQSWEMLP